MGQTAPGSKYHIYGYIFKNLIVWYFITKGSLMLKGCCL